MDVEGDLAFHSTASSSTTPRSRRARRVARSRRTRGSATRCGRWRRDTCFARPPTLAEDTAFAVEAQAMLAHDGWVRLTERAERLQRLHDRLERSRLFRPVRGERIAPWRRVSHPLSFAAATSGARGPPMSDIPSDRPVTLIRPVRRSGMPEFWEVWRSRDLALILAWRDVKVRYKQSLIGIAWAVLQPLRDGRVHGHLRKFADLPLAGAPYLVFSMLNLVAWTFLASVFTPTSACVLTNRVLVQKVHFPLLILPLACILVPLVDFAFSFTVGLGITWHYDVAIQPTVFQSRCSS